MPRKEYRLLAQDIRFFLLGGSLGSGVVGLLVVFASLIFSLVAHHGRHLLWCDAFVVAADRPPASRRAAVAARLKHLGFKMSDAEVFAIFARGKDIGDKKKLLYERLKRWGETYRDQDRLRGVVRHLVQARRPS